MKNFILLFILIANMLYNNEAYSKIIEFGPEFYRFTFDIPENWTHTIDDNGCTLESNDNNNFIIVRVHRYDGTEINIKAKEIAKKLGFKTETIKSDKNNISMLCADKNGNGYNLLLHKDGNIVLSYVIAGSNLNEIQHILKTWKVVHGLQDDANYRKSSSESMEDTIKKGQKLHLIAIDRDIKYGDIVAYTRNVSNSRLYVHRIVGLPGDIIEIKNKQFFRNGNAVDEEYIKITDTKILPPRDNLGPIKLGKNKYFVMGDNRDCALDSRFIGPVDYSSIKHIVEVEKD